MAFPSSPANNEQYVTATGEILIWRNDKSSWRKLRPGDEVIYYQNEETISADITITEAGRNAMSAGPVEIANGVTVTVPSTVTWTIVGG